MPFVERLLLASAPWSGVQAAYLPICGVWPQVSCFGDRLVMGCIVNLNG